MKALVWLVFATVGLLSAWRFWLIGHTGISLYVDEAYYWGWAQNLAWGYYSKPPLVAWLIAASTALFGNGVLGVKALAMLLYPATAGVLYVLGRDLFNERCGHALAQRVGLVAALLFASSFMVGLLGLFVSTDSLLVLCWALAAWCWWRAAASGRLGWWAACGVVLGLGLLSKYTMAAFAATALYSLWAHRSPSGHRLWRAPGPWIAAAVALALFAPHLMWNWQNGMPTLRHTAEITATGLRSGGWASVAEFWAGQLLMLGPVPLMVVLGVGSGLLWARALIPLRLHGYLLPLQHAGEGRGNGPGGGRALFPRAPHPVSLPDGRRGNTHPNNPIHYLLSLSVPLLAVTTAQSFRAQSNLNWAAPAYVAISLLFAAWACGALANRSHPRWLGITLAVNAVLVAFVCHATDIARLIGQPLPKNTDAFVRMRGWHEALRMLQPIAAQHPGLPVLGVGRTLLAQTTYEWRGLGTRPVAWNPQGRADDQYQLTTHLQPLLGKDVMLVMQGPVPPDVAQRFESLDLLGNVTVGTAPNRQLAITLWRARAFKGYAPLISR